ncbi:MAG: hypothetical protein DMD72_00345 [Gemmatimonadetes bacterium]|nr:MAG: hypothetical protein DMD72_00345 [Gemmatimonadota bacterium]
MNQTFLDYYRCPENFGDFTLTAAAGGRSGFFLFGENVYCYGLTSAGAVADEVRPGLYDAMADVVIEGTSLRLPFNPTEVIENLRRERYVRSARDGFGKASEEHPLADAYRVLRPALPLAIRRRLQKLYLRGWESLRFPSWPVDRTVDNICERLLTLVLKCQGVDRIPFIWFWPEGAPGCAIVTHDVEGVSGKNFCSRLMDLDDSVGIKASFQIVPERRYPVTAAFLDGIRGRGFEINIHDINHDGRLFAEREGFLRRAERINSYAKEFGAQGFRSGALYRRPEWYEALDSAYDMSIPNVAHLDPQRGGCCTVLPFFIGKTLELPLTTTQDYSLFNILDNYSIDLWKQQIALIAEKHGLVSFIVHPDYVIEKRARASYLALLAYLVQLRAGGMLWIALPNEVNQWWRERSQMTVVPNERGFRIEGKGKERARLAFATLVENKLTFTIENQR